MSHQNETKYRRFEHQLKPLGSLPENLVGDHLAERGVDLVKTGERDADHRTLVLIAPGHGDGLSRPVTEQHPVGQAGQGIEVGKIIEPLFGIPAVGDVLRHTEDDMRPAVFVVHRIGRNEQDEHPAALVANANLGFALLDLVVQEIRHEPVQPRQLILKHVAAQLVAGHAPHRIDAQQMA